MTSPLAHPTPAPTIAAAPRRPSARLAAAPYVCAALHAAALLAMLLVLRGGTEAEPQLAARMAYVHAHATAWRAGFAVWMAAGMSVVAFYAWWAGWVRSRAAAVTALVLACAGLACDLSGEALYSAWLPQLSADAARFDQIQRLGTVLTAVFANGFYTAAGIVLTLGTPALPRRIRGVAWVVWIAGVALSVAGAMGWAAGLVIASGVLFPALVLLALMLPRALR
jgi:hypothetical protein